MQKTECIATLGKGFVPQEKISSEIIFEAVLLCYLQPLTVSNINHDCFIRVCDCFFSIRVRNLLLRARLRRPSRVQDRSKI